MHRSMEIASAVMPTRVRAQTWRSRAVSAGQASLEARLELREPKRRGDLRLTHVHELAMPRQKRQRDFGERRQALELVAAEVTGIVSCATGSGRAKGRRSVSAGSPVRKPRVGRSIPADRRSPESVRPHAQRCERATGRRPPDDLVQGIDLVIVRCIFARHFLGVPATRPGGIEVGQFRRAIRCGRERHRHDRSSPVC